MGLFQVDPHKWLEAGEVSSVAAGVVYYVHTGRNAWHSTWVAQYEKDCMHTTIGSAKEYAETRRKSGTVFYIEQLPCLVFRSRDQVLLVTEINNKKPLSGYSPDAVSSSPAEGETLVKGALDNYISIGAPFIGVGLSFVPASRFWRVKPNPKNSIIFLSHSNSSVPVEGKDFDRLTAYKSYANGGGYYLGWRSIENNIDPSAVISIVKSKSSRRSCGSAVDRGAHSPVPIGGKFGGEQVGEKVRSLHGHDQGAHSAFIRLRKMAVAHGDKGASSARDDTIRAFLDELSEVINYKVIDRLSDASLRRSYVRWVDAVVCGAESEDRLKWLSSGVLLSVEEFKFYV